MITAKEARNKIESAETERTKQEMQEAEWKIMRAIETCKNSCWLGFYASDATIKWLKSLGYQTRRIVNQVSGDETEVRW